MIWDKYPFSNVHELNLDWIIKVVTELLKEFDNLSNEVKEAILKIDKDLDELQNQFDDFLEDNQEVFNQWLIEKEPEIALIVNAYIESHLSDFIAHAQYIDSNETLKIGDGESGEVQTPTVDISDLFNSEYINQLIAVAKNGVVYLSFQSTIQSISEYDTMRQNNTPLFTIPSAYRPNYKGSQYYANFVINNIAVGNVNYRKSDGQVRINQLSEPLGNATSSSQGRLYFECCYPYL